MMKKLFLLGLALVGLSALVLSQTATTTDPVVTERTVTLNSRVVLTASAEGTTPFTFNWYKNNVWVGVSDNLTFDRIQVADAGTYKVVANNSAGTAESAPLTIIVFVPIAPNKVKITVTVVPS
jgi:hypothetical protein